MHITGATELTNRDMNLWLGAGENGIWALNRTAEPFDLFCQAVDAGCVTNEDFDAYIRGSATPGTAQPVIEAEIIDLDTARRERETPYLGYLATAGN